VIVHDAAATAITLRHALLAWLPVAGTVAAMLVCAAVAVAAPGVRAVRKRLGGPSWARGRVRARILARGRLTRSRGRLSPQRPQRGPLRGSGAPHSPSRGSRVAERAPGGSQGPSTPPWAHTQPLDYDEAA
jgi:hypothetical protein